MNRKYIPHVILSCIICFSLISIFISLESHGRASRGVRIKFSLRTIVQNNANVTNEKITNFVKVDKHLAIIPGIMFWPLGGTAESSNNKPALLFASLNEARVFKDNGVEMQAVYGFHLETIKDITSFTINHASCSPEKMHYRGKIETIIGTKRRRSQLKNVHVRLIKMITVEPYILYSYKFRLERNHSELEIYCDGLSKMDMLY